MRLYRLDAIILFFKEADHRRVLHSFPTRRSSDLLALHNAPSMVQVAGETRTRGAEVRAAYAAFVPGVTLSAGATRQYTSRSEEHTSELQSRENLVCRLLLEKKNRD